jgi:CubicO group peptidase (beta-lactamase class C family)
MGALLAAGVALLLGGCGRKGGAPAGRAGGAPDSVVVAARIRQVEEQVEFARIRVAGRPDQTLLQRMAHHRIDALSLAVIHDYRLEWARAYGTADAEARRPATVETLFQPGSISKSLNALALLRLAQAGRIDLDADINRYLTSWRFPYDSVAAGAIITPGMLLSHTAGLSVQGFRGYAPGDSLPSVNDILDGRRPAVNEPVRSRIAPGLRFKYSGGGTMIAQRILMDLTGLPYDIYLRDSVLVPLGMTSSSFEQPPPVELAGRRATGYTEGGRRVPGGHTILAEQAAGGLWTTPSDLARFVIELQRAREGRSNRLLTRTMARLMTAPYLEGSQGLGVFLEEIGGARYFQHAAGNIGFSGVYYGSLEGGDGVVVCVNTDEGAEILREVVATVARVYRWAGFETGPAPIVRDTVGVPVELRAICAGLYREKTSVVSIEMEGPRLRYRASAEPWDIDFTSPTTFLSQESAAEKRLSFDAAGAVTGFTRLVEGDSVGYAARVREVPLPDSLLARYAGSYRDIDNEPLLLTRTQAGLLLVREETPRPVRFLSAAEFFTREDFGSLFRVVRDGAGAITGISIETGDRKEFCRRVGS